MDEDELVVPRREVHVEFEDFEFVARVLVEANFADAEHIRALKKFRNQRDDFLGEFDVLSFFGVDA